MNTRFAVAVHVLTLLEQSGGEPVTSGYLAGSVNTNASLVRRLLARLGRAGLTTSQMGTGGGALLARPAGAITLLDVYRAVDEGRDVVPVHPLPNPRCPVGRNIQAALTTHFDAATRALEAEFARTTVADVLRDVRRHDGGRPAGARRRASPPHPRRRSDP